MGFDLDQILEVVGKENFRGKEHFKVKICGLKETEIQSPAWSMSVYHDMGSTLGFEIEALG